MTIALRAVSQNECNNHGKETSTTQQYTNTTIMASTNPTSSIYKLAIMIPSSSNNYVYPNNYILLLLNFMHVFCRVFSRHPMEKELQLLLPGVNCTKVQLETDQQTSTLRWPCPPIANAASETPNQDNLEGHPSKLIT